MRGIFLCAFLLAVSLSANADLECANSETNQQATWLVNQDPNVAMGNLSVDVDHESHLVCLAWGNEKAYLKNNFPGLQWRNNQNTLIWQGDEARYIINNL
jgi:hypothetical protein